MQYSAVPLFGGNPVIICNHPTPSPYSLQMVLREDQASGRGEEATAEQQPDGHLPDP